MSISETARIFITFLKLDSPNNKAFLVNMNKILRYIRMQFLDSNNVIFTFSNNSKTFTALNMTNYKNYNLEILSPTDKKGDRNF